MKKILSCVLVIIALMLAVSGGRAIPPQDKYTLKVPNGLAFSEFRGDTSPGRLSPSVRTGPPSPRSSLIL